MKHTKEEHPYFWSGSSLMKSNNNGTFSSSHILCTDKIMPTEKQIKFIVEAFNVTNETGKSPRQLADENKELLELLDLIILNEINLEQEGKKCNFSGPVYLKALQLKNKGSHQQSN